MNKTNVIGNLISSRSRFACCGKRGISAVVAVVLTILITIAAVAILWIGIRPNIEMSDIIGAGSSFDMHLSIPTVGGYTVYDEASHFAFVQVKRGVDDTNIVALEIIFNIEGNSVKFKLDNVPAINGHETYPFDFDYYGVVGIPETVSVAPIFVRNKKEKVGDILDKVDMPVKRISEITFADEVKARESKVTPSIPVCGDRNCQDGETCYDGVGSDCLVDCNICPMLVAYWDFDDDNAVDETGNTEEGVPFNSSGDLTRSPVYVDTPWGRGLKVSGGPGCNGIRVNDSDFLDVSGVMSISTWVKYDSFHGHGKVAIKAYKNNANPKPWEIYSLDVKNKEGYYPNFLWSDGDEASGNDAIANTSYILNLGEWYHLTGVMEGTTSRLYVNGTLVATEEIGEFMAINDQDFYIGGVDTLSFCTNGTIDELMIFSYALSDAEVYNLYSTGNIPSTP